jgi:hypothetical protein
MEADLSTFIALELTKMTRWSISPDPSTAGRIQANPKSIEIIRNIIRTKF